MIESRERSVAIARRIVVVLSVLWFAALGVVFIERITFPLELEWMEGGTLQQALRIQRGQPIYGPPSAEYVPFLYTPLYPAIVAVLGWVFPLGYALGRFVSWVAVVAVGFALVRAVRYEGKPRSHQLAAAGLFCAGYVFTFRWLDLARNDSSFLALLIWGLVVLRETGDRHRTAMLAGLLIVLAFWTKQTAAVFVVASGLGAVLVAPGRLWVFASTIAALAGGGVLIGNAMTDGWLWTYIYELHQGHAFNRERFTTKTWGMFSHFAPLLVLLTLGLLAGIGQRLVPRAHGQEPLDEVSKSRALGSAYWGLMAVAGLLVSALGYSTQWAEPNAFIPGVCFGALWLAVATPTGGWRELMALGCIAGQLLLTALVEPRYQPIQRDGATGIPGSYHWQDLSRTFVGGERRARARAVREHLESVEGEVFALQRPWWNVLSGGPGHVGSMGLNDIAEADKHAVRDALREVFAQTRYAEIWVEGEPPPWLRRAIARSYRLDRRLQGDERVRPMSGYMSDAGMVEPYRKDQLVFVPLGQRARPDGARVIADFEDGTLQGFRRSGAGFPARPTPGLRGAAPAVGPYGGEYLLSGALRPDGTGMIESPPIELRGGSALECLIGATGPSDALSVSVFEIGGDRESSIPVPDTRYELEPVRWEIPADWADARVRVRFVDDDRHAALMFDDLWLVP